MQSTVLKDRHGKEIYEGDILKLVGNETTSAVYSRMAFLADEPDKQTLVYSVLSEVTGNIYENPELLNENGTRTAERV